MSCPPFYETYIDMIKPSHVQYVIWFYFRKTTDRITAKCKECDQLIEFDDDTSVLVDHLKEDHYTGDGSDVRYSYKKYLEQLSRTVHYHSNHYPENKKNTLKLSFGVRYAEKFMLVRFPECRKGRISYPEKKNFRSDWQKKVCETFSNHPVGSYQGHFDRPITFNVYQGNRVLSFKEYTEFTHSPKDICQHYEVDKDRYLKLDDLQKIKALKASIVENDVHIAGPCSRDCDMSLS